MALTGLDWNTINPLSVAPIGTRDSVSCILMKRYDGTIAINCFYMPNGIFTPATNITMDVRITHLAF